MESTILANAPLYASSSSQLQSLKDLTPPPVSASTALIAIQPELALLELEQDGQALEIAQLRERSAMLLQRWYEIGVLGWGECWQEWDERLARIEQRIRRAESRKTREEKV